MTSPSTRGGSRPSRNSNGSIPTMARKSSYRTWKCGGLWSLKYIVTTIQRNRLISGIGQDGQKSEHCFVKILDQLVMTFRVFGPTGNCGYCRPVSALPLVHYDIPFHGPDPEMAPPLTFYRTPGIDSS